MAVRSTIEIEIDDAAFKRYTAAYAKYEEALKDAPQAWAKVNKTIDGTKKTFEGLVAGMIAARAEEELRAEAAKEVDRLTRSTSDRWHNLAKDSKTFLGNIAEATKSLLKWASLTSIIGGLLGAGGLFGIDRLAISAASSRRSALGIGATTGEQQAFKISFGRAVDADSFLGNVNDALHDQQKRWIFQGAGLSEKDLQSNDSALVGAKLIPSIKALLDQTPDAQLAQVMHAHGIDQMMSIDDATRLKKMPAAEAAQMGATFDKNRNSLGFSDEIGKEWQNFSTQMQLAGASIEATFIKGLAPLAPELTDLSASFSDLVKTLLESPQIKEWIEDLAAGLKEFAHYIGTPEFKQDVIDFAEGVEHLAISVKNALQWLVGAPPPTSNDNTILKGPGFELKRDNRSLWERLKNPIPPSSDVAPAPTTNPNDAASLNNPLGIRDPKTGAFVKYASVEDGLRAADRQLERYQDKYGKDTIRGIVEKWSPAAAGNDVESYVKDVSEGSHFLPDQHLDLHDRDTVAKLISAMAKHENKNQNYPKQMVITVLNNTGGSAVVSTAQLAR